MISFEPMDKEFFVFPQYTFQKWEKIKQTATQKETNL